MCFCASKRQNELDSSAFFYIIFKLSINLDLIQVCFTNKKKKKKMRESGDFFLLLFFNYCFILFQYNHLVYTSSWQY